MAPQLPYNTSSTRRQSTITEKSVPENFAMKAPKIFVLLVLMVSVALAAKKEENEETMNTYIIHFDHVAEMDYADKMEWHSSALARATAYPESRLLYSYESVINGFAAKLSEAEVAELKKIEGFVAAYPDRRHEVQTTYSYKFLGLDAPGAKLWRHAKFGEGAIIGVLDTGIWPESPSFDDSGLPPVPARWKGACQNGAEFNSSHCNRKLVGARFYNCGHQANAAFGTRPEYESPRDSQGHGTHTASTAAGRPVAGAHLLGNARGTARGTAPSARVAMYKVCWDGGCYSSDILAGMEAAIRDGVDVISLSIGGFSVPFYEDSVAVGAFRAATSGVFVAAAGGNSGPYAFSVSNEAPWIATVGAATVDRDFPAVVSLGNGRIFRGQSLYPRSRNSSTFFPLVYAKTAGKTKNAKYCFPGTLDPDAVRGRIVVCDRGSTARAEKGEVVLSAGGRGMILADSQINGEETAADAHVLPATQVGYAEAEAIKRYINSSTARAAINFQGTVYRASRAPAVASFSSRGPSSVNPWVLKPDVIAPGVNILAAWPLNLAPSGLQFDGRRVMFNVVSGTSMACPHVAGVAALLKVLRPGWSIAAIKSAIMTTAAVTDTRGGAVLDSAKSRRAAADVFAMGAGHINPEIASDPGLIYDMGIEYYIGHLCSLGYTKSQIRVITRRYVDCAVVPNRYRELNYPSISAIFNVSSSSPGNRYVKLKRTVTNIGVAESTYSIKVVAPRGVRVVVRPRQLVFSRLNEKKSYSVKLVDRIERKISGDPSYYSTSQGSLTWVHSRNSSVVYRVRSPIAIIWAT